MKRMNSWKLAFIAVTLSLGCLFLNCLGAGEPQTQPALPDLSHVVPFKIGAISADGDDNITITQVHGSLDTIGVGGTYEVKGTYHLVSKDQAMLAVYVTANQAESAHSKVGPVFHQDQIVGRGDGEFTLIFSMVCKGFPHVNFYPTDNGSSIASVYFGTGESLSRN
jgi:hypothetical protein